MESGCCDALRLTTAVSTLAVALAEELGDEELALAASMFVQLGDTLATISAQRSLCAKEDPGR